MTTLELKNFKAFSQDGLSFSCLNLLTGANSTGKSSIIQSLLLLRQSYLAGHFTNPTKPSSLTLGDEKSLVRIGSFQDVFHEWAERRDHIEIYYTGKEASLKFESNSYDLDKRDSHLFVGSEGHLIEGKLETSGDWEGLSLFKYDSFQYLSSDRIAPQESYANPIDGTGSYLGSRGEYVAYVLDVFGNKPIQIEGLKHSDTQRPDQDTLLWQTNYWLNEISQCIEVSTKPSNNGNRTVLNFSYQVNGVSQSSRKPQNVGYGMVPVLPVIVAILCAKPGDMIIIENPELHLHPSAQATITKLICLAASFDVQFIVESHSDHVLNNILLQLKAYNDDNSKGLADDRANVYFFERVDGTRHTSIIPIEILPGGRLSHQPKGFFDQFNRDFEALMGF